MQLQIKSTANMLGKDAMDLWRGEYMYQQATSGNVSRV